MCGAILEICLLMVVRQYEKWCLCCLWRGGIVRLELTVAPETSFHLPGPLWLTARGWTLAFSPLWDSLPPQSHPSLSLSSSDWRPNTKCKSCPCIQSEGLRTTCPILSESCPTCTHLHSVVPLIVERRGLGGLLRAGICWLHRGISDFLEHTLMMPPAPSNASVSFPVPLC